MADWDFSKATIELRTVERMWPSRWCALLSIPWVEDDLLALQSYHYARTREGAIKKARRSLDQGKLEEASRERLPA